MSPLKLPPIDRLPALCSKGFKHKHLSSTWAVRPLRGVLKSVGSTGVMTGEGLLTDNWLKNHSCTTNSLENRMLNQHITRDPAVPLLDPIKIRAPVHQVKVFKETAHMLTPSTFHAMENSSNKHELTASGKTINEIHRPYGEVRGTRQSTSCRPRV